MTDPHQIRDIMGLLLEQGFAIVPFKRGDRRAGKLARNNLYRKIRRHGLKWRINTDTARGELRVTVRQ